MKALGNFVFAIVLLVIVSTLVEGIVAVPLQAPVSSRSQSRSTRNDDPSPFWAARGKRTLCNNCEVETQGAGLSVSVQDSDEYQQQQLSKHFAAGANPMFSYPKFFQRFRILNDPFMWNFYDDSGPAAASPAVEPLNSNSYLQSRPQMQLHYGADGGYIYSPPFHKPAATKKQDAANEAAPFWAARG